MQRRRRCQRHKTNMRATPFSVGGLIGESEGWQNVNMRFVLHNAIWGRYRLMNFPSSSGALLTAPAQPGFSASWQLAARSWQLPVAGMLSHAQRVHSAPQPNAGTCRASQRVAVPRVVLYLGLSKDNWGCAGTFGFGGGGDRLAWGAPRDAIRALLLRPDFGVEGVWSKGYAPKCSVSPHVTLPGGSSSLANTGGLATPAMSGNMNSLMFCPMTSSRDGYSTTAERNVTGGAFRHD
eukprot:gene7952-biopygen3092